MLGEPGTVNSAGFCFSAGFTQLKDAGEIAFDLQFGPFADRHNDDSFDEGANEFECLVATCGICDRGPERLDLPAVNLCKIGMDQSDLTAFLYR